MFLSLNTSGHKFSVISTTTSSMMFNSISDSSLPLLSDINYSSVISMYSTTKSSMMFNSMSHSSLSFWHQLFLIDFYNQVCHDDSFHGQILPCLYFSDINYSSLISTCIRFIGEFSSVVRFSSDLFLYLWQIHPWFLCFFQIYLLHLNLLLDFRKIFHIWVRFIRDFWRPIHRDILNCFCRFLKSKVCS